jgi:hypothetical protein
MPTSTPKTDSSTFLRATLYLLEDVLGHAGYAYQGLEPEHAALFDLSAAREDYAVLHTAIALGSAVSSVLEALYAFRRVGGVVPLEDIQKWDAEVAKLREVHGEEPYWPQAMLEAVGRTIRGLPSPRPSPRKSPLGVGSPSRPTRPAMACLSPGTPPLSRSPSQPKRAAEHYSSASSPKRRRCTDASPVVCEAVSLPSEWRPSMATP